MQGYDKRTVASYWSFDFLLFIDGYLPDAQKLACLWACLASPKQAFFGAPSTITPAVCLSQEKQNASCCL